MQPFSVAKLQARIIEHDENCMYEVLEDCSWDFEKVGSPDSDRASRHGFVVMNIDNTVCAALYLTSYLASCGVSVWTKVLTCGVFVTEGSTPLDPSSQSL